MIAKVTRCEVGRSTVASRLGVIVPLLLFLLLFEGCAALSEGSGSNSSISTLTLSAILPHAIVGVTYKASINVSGGLPPYEYVIASGNLPTGLLLSAATGGISGTPTSSGNFEFAISVSDKHNPPTQQFFKIAVSPAQSIVVVVAPATTTVSSGGMIQFKADVMNSPDEAVVWSATKGTISSSGVYAAPRVTANTTTTVVAASLADPTKSASAAVTITPPSIVVLVAPANTTVSSGASVQFTANVMNSPNRTVSWSTTEGTISSTGLYTAPQVTANTTTTVMAGSIADPTKSASAKVNITPLSIVVVIAPTNRNVYSGAAVQFTATVMNSPNEGVAWSTPEGTISSTGLYTAPQVMADATTTVVAASVADPTKSASATVNIIFTQPPDPDDAYCGAGNVPIGATVDGPANMPSRCFNTNPLNTPSPGNVIPVMAGGDLQKAYDSLLCGQTLSLAHGAVWEGPFQFTPKGCDDQHWLTITSDGLIPAAGTRLGPTYLPQLATISMHPGASANMVTGDHIRFIGIAWLKAEGKQLVDFVEAPGALKVIFDRNYAHGNSGEETRRFISLDNASYVAIVESWVDEMHCIALTGTCTDAQAIAGGADTVASGPFKIVNNTLSAAGENILLGGGSATNTPCDAEIRTNYMYKPISWNPNDPTYGGVLYVVKNLFELKNACRVLFEGNYLANNWGGFTQIGSAIMIGPKNQEGTTGANLCPVCFISDLVMRYNYITTAAGGFELYNVRTVALGGWAAGGHNYSIHDMIFDNLGYATCYECSLNLGQVSSGYLSTDPPPIADVMHDVLINHLTIVNVPTWPPAGAKREYAMMIMDGVPASNVSATPQMSNIVYENSLFGGGNYGFYPTGGGSDNCSVAPKNLAAMIADCWAGNSLFSGNLVVAYTGKSTWPNGNLFSTSWSNVDFVNYNNGAGGDYHLAEGSPFKGLGLDGTDPGADIDLVLQYTSNAQQ